MTDCCLYIQYVMGNVAASQPIPHQQTLALESPKQGPKHQGQIDSPGPPMVTLEFLTVSQWASAEMDVCLFFAWDETSGVESMCGINTMPSSRLCLPL